MDNEVMVLDFDIFRASGELIKQRETLELVCGSSFEGVFAVKSFPERQL